ncbi:hypothetical protein Tsubulata_018998 [Turnera subulata]|uniref:Histone chaperone domain-containing protein n=1 Tax=Turnera subulata TaxID=218843 RepID=A0A9Q0GLW4_9ROSI|nr:hypothetical protein Tsubulata_018998 [Turnera subulata]
MAEGEEARDTVAAKEEEEEEPKGGEDIESRIRDAMRSRVNHFKDQSDSLTFEGVRRLLEKDMGLEECALDVHKRFVKQCLLQSMGDAVDDTASKDSGETRNNHNGVNKLQPPETVADSRNQKKEPSSEDDDKMEDSPVMGLLASQTPNTKTRDSENQPVPSESSIKKAIWKRASYIKSNAEEVTMAGLRRILEQDLGLPKLTLDPYKKFISKELDEVLKSSEVAEPKKKTLVKKTSGKASRKMSSENNLDSSDKSGEEDEDEVKPKKKSGPERKGQKAEDSKKRKRPEKETKVPGKKRVKPEETVAEDNSDAEESEHDSEDSHSPSPAAKSVKKKEAPTPVYGKHVEHLKSVPENKREAQLIKELEEILSREGLSSNPSEKEIKEVRKRKQRAKELEGIDTSNIVSTSRRRSTTSFVPPKPIPAEKNDSDDAGDSDDEDDDEDDEDEEDADGDDDSQSEEVNGDNDEDSD